MALYNRHIVLFLTRCRCSRALDQLANLDIYLLGLFDLVSDTTSEVRWFAENHLLAFLPVNTRCNVLYQHALNLFWFHGHALDEEIRNPAAALHYYAALDDEYGTRYGTGFIAHFVRHIVRLVVDVYDASSVAVPEGSRKGFPHFSGRLDLESLSLAEKIRLAKISHLLSLVIDYGFSSSEWFSIDSDTIFHLLRRMRTNRPTNDCSLSDDSPTSSGFSESYSSSVQSTDTPEGTQGFEDITISWVEFEPSHIPSSTQGPLSVSTPSDSEAFARNDHHTGSSLERFDAVTDCLSKHSMQEWAGELEEFMSPLFGI